jgi:hypothetical protein
MRKKEVNLDGQSYTISPLSLSQVTTFLEKQRDALAIKDGKKVGDADPKKLEAVWREFLCFGLNNAGKDANDFIVWTTERILDELDLKFFELLRDELLDFSGLSPAEQGTSPGEAKAAS